jgi:hypothetical protein
MNAQTEMAKFLKSKYMTNEQAIKLLNSKFSHDSTPSESTALVFASENIVHDDIDTFLLRKPSELISEMIPYVQEAYESKLDKFPESHKKSVSILGSSMMRSIDAIFKYVQMHEELTQASESER